MFFLVAYGLFCGCGRLWLPRVWWWLAQGGVMFMQHAVLPPCPQGVLRGTLIENVLKLNYFCMVMRCVWRDVRNLDVKFHLVCAKSECIN